MKSILDCPRTQLCLETHLPRVLATLSHEYLFPALVYDRGVTFSGHGELCEKILDHESGLFGACEGGHVEIARMMIIRSRWEHYWYGWNWGLNYACLNGHHDVAELLIAHGATNFNLGLSQACRGGHIEMVRMMIANGACDFVSARALALACSHDDIAKMLTDLIDSE